MKKYKNVRAIKARKCDGYADHSGAKYCYSDCDSYCWGVSETFKNPTCGGYKCKCTEYKYDKKRGDFV